VVLAVRLLSL
jgi:hypothetical protein